MKCFFVADEPIDRDSILYKIILEECEQNEIGWLAWSWGPGNNPQTDLHMTTDGNFNSLHN